MAFMHLGVSDNMSTLVQVMDCSLLGAKPLPEPMKTYSQLDAYEMNKILLNFNENMKKFIEGNALQNVICKMSAIFV